MFAAFVFETTDEVEIEMGRKVSDSHLSNVQ